MNDKVKHQKIKKHDWYYVQQTLGKVLNRILKTYNQNYIDLIKS